MATNIRSIKIFVASPGDVAAERQIASSVISQVDKTFVEMFDTTLAVLRWESEPPLTKLVTLQSIQEGINEKVKECDILILILASRIGSKEKGFNDHNTKREIDLMIERIRRGERVFMLTYYKYIKENYDPGEQEKEVKILRNSLQDINISHNDYSDIYEFEKRLTHDLFKTVLLYLWDTPKQKATKLFWQLGEAEQPTSTRLAIVYPPIDRSYTEKEKPDIYWHKRLAPNIVFEDYKALQKLQKSMRMIGLGDYRIYTTSSIPKDIRYMNRVWICLPRNFCAQKQLSIYQSNNRCLFKIIPPTNKSLAQILWKNSISNENYFKVKSPLSDYLILQRGEEMKGGEWKGEMEHIVAKDFAILARFGDSRPNIDTKVGYLYDYFFAGIRGLGTWGATWFLDRRSKTFLNYEKYNDIQLLLEVTYWDGKILDVRDVSSESPSYFKEQLKISNIKKNIKELGQY